MSPDEMITWYRDAYFGGVYQHTYDHDYEVAAIRMAAYRGIGIALDRGIKLLDVGSGNGAFLDRCQSEGVMATGCDPHASHRCTYPGALADARFPTESFDLVTFHDSLEHVPDPIAVLSEAARCLRTDGHLIIDFPHFFSDAGTHHWKRTEHLWFLNTDQLRSAAERCGFRFERSYSPIPSKIVLHLRRAPVKRTRILVPPGIGDIYWVLCRLQAFVDLHGCSLPDIYVSSPDPSRDRSAEFVSMFPFVHFAGYYPHDTRKDKIWKQAYMQDGNGVFRNVHGFDWFLSANGPMRFGKTLDQCFPGCTTNWYPPMFESIDQRTYRARMGRGLGKYIVAFFTHHGMYEQHWLRELSRDRLFEALRGIHAETGARIVLTGARWDSEGGEKNVNAYLMAKARKLPVESRFIIDLTGQTSLDQFFGLMRGALGCIGFCGGNTIMSTVFRKPTVIFWNKYFDERFWRNACPPDGLGRWYRPLNTQTPNVSIISAMTSAIVDGEAR
jgi:SAM-dependent methyltransferase